MFIKIDINELFFLEDEKTIVKAFWERYDLKEVTKLMVISGTDSIIELYGDNQKEIEFELSFDDEFEKKLGVKIKVVSFEGRDINDFKAEGGEYCNKIVNDTVSFEEEFKKELKTILTLTSSSVIDESRKSLIEEIKNNKKENKTAEEIVTKVLDIVGIKMFAELNKSLILKEKIVTEKSKKYFA